MTVCYWCGAKDTLADIGKELDGGKYKMVQCSKCKNAYYVVNKEKMNKPKPQTNEEYLKSCTTEQLAEWLRGVYWHCHEIDCEHCNYPWRCMEKGDIVKWLKQTHKENE